MVYVNSANRELIFDAIRAVYTDIARNPSRGYHIPTGHAACTLVGYPAEQMTPESLAHDIRVLEAEPA